MASAAYHNPGDGSNHNEEKGCSSDDEPDEQPVVRSLVADESLLSLRMQSQAHVQIYFRSNPYYDDLIPKLKEHLENYFGHRVDIHSFERGTSPEEIRAAILAERDNLGESLLLFDVTCRKSFPNSEINIDQIESAFMPISLGSYIDQILLNQVAGEIDLVREEKPAQLDDASSRLRDSYTKLESSHRAVVHLLSMIEKAESDFNEVLISPRHLIDHPPLIEFYYNSLHEYLQISGQELSKLSATNGTSAEHARISREREVIRSFMSEFDSFPLGERLFCATFPEEVHEILQREIGDRFGIQIQQPVDLIRSWVQESGLAAGNTRILPNKELAELAPGDLRIPEDTLLIADRHFCNRNELVAAGIEVDGALALFPMTDFYDSLRAQNLVNRRDLLKGEDILDHLVEDLSDAIRRAELHRLH